MLLKLTLEILIWKLKRITQNVVKVLEQDIDAILPALAGRLATGLVENGKGVIEMKKSIIALFIGAVAALGIFFQDEVKDIFIGEQPVICELCVDECPCVEDECVCVATCICSNCVS